MRMRGVIFSNMIIKLIIPKHSFNAAAAPPRSRSRALDPVAAFKHKNIIIKLTI